VVLEEGPINSEDAALFPPGMMTALSIRHQGKGTSPAPRPGHWADIADTPGVGRTLKTIEVGRFTNPPCRNRLMPLRLSSRHSRVVSPSS
jgi:hypothetical protein